MRIVCISDTHGSQPDLPDGDVLVFAGDLCYPQSTMAEVERFASWMQRQPHKYKLVTAGNHDFPFERNPIGARKVMAAYGLKYLEDSGLEVGGFQFWGSPWQPEFGGWAFNLPRGIKLAEKWALIPENVDVLVTHSPPRGVRDPGTGESAIGCGDLAVALQSRLHPKLHVFGHSHGGYGTTRLGSIIFVNASICDSNYRPVNKPIVIDLV